MISRMIQNDGDILFYACTKRGIKQKDYNNGALTNGIKKSNRQVRLVSVGS